MMSRHTPKPWSVYVNNHRSAVVRSKFPDGQERCVVAKVDGEHALADARLIAAAPDLLEALKAIQQFGIDTLSGPAEGPDDRAWQRAGVLEMTKRASAAIAKAEWQ